MVGFQAIDSTLEGDIDNRLQAPEPVGIQVRVRLAVVILPGRSSQNRNKTVLFQIPGQFNQVLVCRRDVKRL